MVVVTLPIPPPRCTCGHGKIDHYFGTVDGRPTSSCFADECDCIAFEDATAVSEPDAGSVTDR